MKTTQRGKKARQGQDIAEGYETPDSRKTIKVRGKKEKERKKQQS